MKHIFYSPTTIKKIIRKKFGLYPLWQKTKAAPACYNLEITRREGSGSKPNYQNNCCRPKLIVKLVQALSNN